MLLLILILLSVFWSRDDVITNSGNGNIFNFDICIMTQQKLQVAGFIRGVNQTSRVLSHKCASLSTYTSLIVTT